MVLITFLLYQCISAYLTSQKSCKKNHQNSDSKTWQICMDIKEKHVHAYPCPPKSSMGKAEKIMQALKPQMWLPFTSTSLRSKYTVAWCWRVKKAKLIWRTVFLHITLWRFQQSYCSKFSQWQAQIRNREIPQHCSQVVQSWVKITQG